MSLLSGQWWRVGGGFGIAFIILYIISVILHGNVPVYDDPIEDIRAFWVDEGQTFLVGEVLLAIAFFLLFLPFVVVLRELLGRAEGSAQIISRVALSAAIISIALAATGAAFWGTLAFGDFAETASDDVIRTFMVIDILAFTTYRVALGAFVLAASLVMLGTGVLWKWLGALGIVDAIFLVVSRFGLLSANPESAPDIMGFLATIGFGLWLLLTSIGMIMRKEEPARQEEPMISVS